jgi:hypothetical protein
MDIRQGSVYEFEIDTILVKLKRKMFRDVQAFSTTISGGAMNGTQLTIPLTDNSGVYDSEPTDVGLKPGLPAASANAWKAAMYFKAGGEIMRHESGVGPQNVTRGALGTTAASHAAGQAVDMAFIIEGNPVDILIGLLITRDPGYQPRQLAHEGIGHYDFWNTVDDNKGPLGLHFETGDIDVQSFLTIRDDWYPRYFGRVSFSRETDFESVMSDTFLKPLGMNLFISRSGALSALILRPPLAGNPNTLDDTNIVGVPDITFTNEEIVNEVRVDYDYDYFGSDPASDTTVIDATSQSAYDRSGDCLLEPTWLRSDLSGESLATRLAKKKMRHHRDPNPTIPLSVLYTQIENDIGDVVNVEIDGLPDPRDGQIGFYRTMLIIGRRPDWQRGMLEFDLINTAYIGHRYGLIAPSGTPDYADATELQRNAYVFASDGTTHRMSDGSDGYEIL